MLARRLGLVTKNNIFYLGDVTRPATHQKGRYQKIRYGPHFLGAKGTTGFEIIETSYHT